MLSQEGKATRALASLLDAATLGASVEVSRHDGEHKAATLAAIVLISRRLSADMRGTITSHRQAARAVADARLATELAAVRVHAPPHLLATRHARIDIDRYRAEMSAQSLATAWSGQTAHAAIQASERGESAARAVADAGRTMGYRATRTAATEVASAYNEEHRVALQYAAENDNAFARELRLVRVVRVWDAILDRRTCTACDRMHGKTAPIGGEFEGGLEPGFHVLCRCIDTISTL